MAYLLQKSCTQAPHRESRETGSEVSSGPDPCFSPILSILSTFPQTEQVNSKMLPVPATKAAQKSPLAQAAPPGSPEPGWLATRILTCPICILREKSQVLESEHGSQWVWHSKGPFGPRLQARGQQRPMLCTWYSSGSAWPLLAFPLYPASLWLGRRHGASNKKSLCASVLLCS